MIAATGRTTAGTIQAKKRGRVVRENGQTCRDMESEVTPLLSSSLITRRLHELHERDLALSAK